jgi:cysteine-rich repeat protein
MDQRARAVSATWIRRGLAEFSRPIRLSIAFVALLGVSASMPSPTLAQTGDFQLVAVGSSTIANGRIIVAGPLGSNDGICDAPVNLVLAGDDVIAVNVIPGSTPRQVGIRRGPNLVLESTAAGGDALTSLVCSGPNGTFESIPAGDDEVRSLDTRCSALCPNPACIIPGNNDVLNTTVVGDDVAVPYISTGNDGILDSTLAGDDQFGPSIFATGTGFRDATCVHAGPDGIAQTGLCGTATLDSGEQCDTAGNSATCDFDCTFPVCGDGIHNVPAGEVCDTGGNSPTCDGDCTLPFCGDGHFNPTTGEQCDDGNALTNDGCTPGCVAEVCGDGILHDGIGEECDDGAGNSNTLPNACRTNCRLAYCGDGVTDSVNSEICDDGDNQNNDDCVLGCVPATCGDGFRKTSGTPPFEQCDDGNLVAGDGCDASCKKEKPLKCGNGVVDAPYCIAGLVGLCTVSADCDTSLGSGDGVCFAEQCDDKNNSDKDDCLNTCLVAFCGDGAVKTKGTPPYEECDDGNATAGDGCTPTCQRECGNGIIDGACAQGLVNQYCNVDTDCDTSLGAGDGVCSTEACDYGIVGVCLPGPTSCSASCTITVCGNEVVECDEQCDLGARNGIPGSGCSSLCERTLVGAQELRGIFECPGAWTMDSPPQDLKFRKQVCKDGAACDHDAVVNGECAFSVGMCLNRPDPVGCQSGPILAVDIPRLKTILPFAAAAAEELTDALGTLTSDAFDAPGRCREGRPRKNCTINTDCDSHLGAGDGICDVATGVAYLPPLDATVNQLSPCTSGRPVVVPVGGRLTMKNYVRRVGALRGDRDTVRLFCVP